MLAHSSSPDNIKKPGHHFDGVVTHSCTIHFIGWVEKPAYKNIWRITIFICSAGGWSKQIELQVKSNVCPCS